MTTKICLPLLFWKFCRYIMPQEYVAIEPYINGDYEKFNSNGGYESDASSLLPAFSHWSWEISGHRYMVNSKIIVNEQIRLNRCSYCFIVWIIDRNKETWPLPVGSWQFVEVLPAILNVQQLFCCLIVRRCRRQAERLNVTAQ